jgi:hypothetical protein
MTSDILSLLEFDSGPWWSTPTIPPAGKYSPEMNVSDLTVNLCESQLITHKKQNKNVSILKITAQMVIFPHQIWDSAVDMT